MLEVMPTQAQLEELMGPAAYKTFAGLVAHIRAHYEMEEIWNPGRKENMYEYKFRRGGKTLCALYPRKNSFGFMVVLGRAEQQVVQQEWAEFSAATRAIYTETPTYHDGRWLMLDMKGDALLPDAFKLLRVKRRPNRKTTSAE